MTVPARLNGVLGGHVHEVRVSHAGELIVGPLEFSQTKFTFLDTDNVPGNLITPLAGHQAILTGYVLETNRNVGVNGANVVLYEANSPDTTTATKTLLSFDMPKQTVRENPLYNVLITEGQWVNAKTDDDDANVTLFFYYRPTDPHLTLGTA